MDQTVDKTAPAKTKESKSRSVAMVHQPWNPSIPPIDVGSIAIWIYECANRLAESYDLTAFARTVKGHPEVSRHAGVDYQRVSIWPGPNSITGKLVSALTNPGGRTPFVKPGFYSAFRNRVAQRLADGGFDIVHLHNMITFPSAFRAASPNAKIILQMHCEWLTQIPPESARALTEPVDQLLACSTYLADKINAHIGNTRRPCLVLPNGVDIDHFCPEGPAGEVKLHGREILFVGRVSPEKGLHNLIEAFSLVQQECPDALLRIVGPDSPTPLEFLVAASDDPRVSALETWYEGSYLDALKDLAGERLGQSIVFEGNVSHSRLPALYRRAAVLANPSLSESFGMSLIEALACGCPVVATTAGGMTDIVDDGENGFLTEADDNAALARSLVGILADEQLRRQLSINARAVAVQKFAWSSIAEQLHHIYSQL